MKECKGPSCSHSKAFVPLSFFHASLLYCRLELVSQFLINWKLFLLQGEENRSNNRSKQIVSIHLLHFIFVSGQRVVCVAPFNHSDVVVGACESGLILGMYKHARKTHWHGIIESCKLARLLLCLCLWLQWSGYHGNPIQQCHVF